MLDAIRCSFESSLLFVACSLSSRAQVASTLQSLHVLPCGSWGPDVHPTMPCRYPPCSSDLHQLSRAGSVGMVLGMLILCGCHGLHHRALGHRILHALHHSHPHVRRHVLHHFRLHSHHLFAHLFALGDELVNDGGHGVRLFASGRGVHPLDEVIESSVHRLHLGHHLLVMGHHGFLHHLLVHHARLARHLHLLRGRRRRRRLLCPQGRGADEGSEEDRDRSTYLHGRLLSFLLDRCCGLIVTGTTMWLPLRHDASRRYLMAAGERGHDLVASSHPDSVRRAAGRSGFPLVE